MWKALFVFLIKISFCIAIFKQWKSPSFPTCRCFVTVQIVHVLVHVVADNHGLLTLLLTPVFMLEANFCNCTLGHHVVIKEVQSTMGFQQCSSISYSKNCDTCFVNVFYLFIIMNKMCYETQMPQYEANFRGGHHRQNPKSRSRCQNLRYKYLVTRNMHTKHKSPITYHSKDMANDKVLQM
jgi:hypothetical protein